MLSIIDRIVSQVQKCTKTFSELFQIQPLQYYHMKAVLVPVKARRISKQKKARPQPYF